MSCSQGHTFTEHSQSGCAACLKSELAFNLRRWQDCAAAYAKERAVRQALEAYLADTSSNAAPTEGETHARGI